jgi:hypothetical protein
MEHHPELPSGELLWAVATAHRFLKQPASTVTCACGHRAKRNTAMEHHPEPPLDELLWTVAMARLIFGPNMSIQARFVLVFPHYHLTCLGMLADRPGGLMLASGLR